MKLEAGFQTGKMGSPSQLIAGTTYQVTVNLVDYKYNIVGSTSPMPVVRVTTNDANDSEPIPAGLNEGTGTRAFGVCMITGGANRTATAEDMTTGKTQDSVSGISVKYGAAKKLQLLVPSQTADPGTSSGKTGSIIAEKAGSQFTVTVNACDEYWNRVSTDTRVVEIDTNDPFDTEPVL